MRRKTSRCTGYLFHRYDDVPQFCIYVAVLDNGAKAPEHLPVFVDVKL